MMCMYLKENQTNKNNIIMTPIEEKFFDLETRYKLDIDTFPETEQNDFEEYFNDLIEATFSIECIYYRVAMEYLMDNDISLSDSLALASDIGYETKELGSELLATILMQNIEQEKLYKAKDDLEKLFNEYLELFKIQ